MEFINKFLFIFLISVFFLFLGEWRVLSLGGVNPNFILLFFLIVSFFKKGHIYLFLLGFFFFFIFLIFMPFWIFKFLLLFLLGFVMFFIRRFLSGNELFDFLVMIFFGTFAFYFLAGVFELGVFDLFLVLKEVVYNSIFGILLWLSLSVFLDSKNSQHEIFRH